MWGRISPHLPVAAVFFQWKKRWTNSSLSEGAGTTSWITPVHVRGFMEEHVCRFKRHLSSLLFAALIISWFMTSAVWMWLIWGHQLCPVILTCWLREEVSLIYAVRLPAHRGALSTAHLHEAEEVSGLPAPIWAITVVQDSQWPIGALYLMIVSVCIHMTLDLQSWCLVCTGWSSYL